MKFILMFITLLVLPQMVVAKEITWKGLLEVEQYNFKDEDDNESGNLVLGTAELELVGKVNDETALNLVLLYEEDPMGDEEASLAVDQAYVLRRFGNIILGAGRMYVPFGVFESEFVTESLIIDLAEANEEVFTASYAKENLEVGFYIYNGDVGEEGKYNHTSDYGAWIGYQLKENTQIQLSYNSNFMSAESMFDLNGDGAADTYTGDLPSAMIVSIIGDYGWMKANLEYFNATAFDEADITFDGDAAKVSGMHFEVAFVTGQWTLAIGMESTEQALSLGLPKSRTLFNLAYAIDEENTLKLESATDSAYDEDVGGTGESSSMIITQWQAEF